jgi:hypothetical protein
MPVPCTTQAGAFGVAPYCAGLGSPPGTVVEVLPASFCEGGSFLKPDVAEFLRSQVTPGHLAYYGTLKPLPSLVPPLQGDYAVVFRLVREPSMNFVVEVDDGSIIALGARGACGGVLPPAADPAWLLPPK